MSQPNATGINFDGLGANGFAPRPIPTARSARVISSSGSTPNFAIYDKAGTLLYGPAAGNTLFTSLGGACAAFNDGDPVVQYDNLADRWVLTQFVVGAPAPAFSHQCVAVSKTGDPLGAYYLYDFPTDTTNFVDYPKWTTWTDAYYMTAHLFNAAGTAFLGAMLYSFDRASMLAGLPAAFQSVNLEPIGGIFGQLVADLDGLTPPPPGSPAYLFAPAAPDWDGTAAPGLHFWTAASTWGGSPTLTVTATPDIATASYNTNLCGFPSACACIPQLGTTQLLDSLPGQLMFRAAYRRVGADESILVSHTVNALVPPANQAAVRWYEIRTPGTTPTVFQQGTYAPTTANRWVSSIAMDESGNIAAGYSISDSTMFPSINITGRLNSDPPNTLGSELSMFAGLGAQDRRPQPVGRLHPDVRRSPRRLFLLVHQPVSAGDRILQLEDANRVVPLPDLRGAFARDDHRPRDGRVGKPDRQRRGPGRCRVLGSHGRDRPLHHRPSARLLQRDGHRSGSRAARRRPHPAATVTDGATTTLNFTLTGAASLAVRSSSIDDSSGNNNGVINRNECFKLNVDLHERRVLRRERRLGLHHDVDAGRGDPRRHIRLPEHRPRRRRVRSDAVLPGHDGGLRLRHGHRRHAGRSPRPPAPRFRR